MTPSIRAAFLLVAGVAYVLAPRILDRAAAPIPGIEARASKQFVMDGEIPMNRGEAPDGASPYGFPRSEEPAGRTRFWSSWNGSDANKGSLALGPFPAPRVLGLAVCGYTRTIGNRLFLENTATSEQIEVSADNIGGSWSDLRVWLPRSWLNVPVVLHAVDGSDAYFGWLAVGEPRVVPVWAAWWNSFARKLHGFAGVGLVLLLLQAAAMTLLRERREIPHTLLPLASLGLVALAAYGVFWVFFASAPAGKALVWLLLAGSAWILLWESSPKVFRGPGAHEARIPILLMAAIGAFYFGVLLLYGSDRNLSDIASRRFIDNLAVDNELPQMVADRLIHGEDPRHLTFGWLSSDRPPLQTACDLLIGYPIGATGVNFDTAAQAAGLWMQLAWVCAAWGWLRAMGASARRAALTIALIAPTGFLMLNTVFVWPKLLAAAFMVGAFSIWISMRSDERNGVRDFVALGILVGLGFLAQAGAAFSILAWIPLAAARMCRQHAYGWAAAALAFALLILPWIAYQRFYNPPGNALLKWHLAGAHAIDSRGTWETLRSAYAFHDMAALLGYRATNIATMFKGPWLDRIFSRGSDLATQRNGEYYGVFFALGVWNLGFIPLAAFLIPAWRNRFDRQTVARIGISIGWCLLTLAAWILLMFAPGSAVIHQGSYACVLLLFCSLALALWLTQAAAFGFIAAVSLVDFAWVWILPNPTRTAHFDSIAAVFAGLACAAVIWIINATMSRVH